jgi:16S rRNA (guanine1207-N2)-methyltransferase
MLAPNGVLWLVANRHLPYEAALAECFREVAPLESAGGYKLVRAARPAAAARPLPAGRRGPRGRR